eukprot:s4043_g2.t1
MLSVSHVLVEASDGRGCGPNTSNGYPFRRRSRACSLFWLVTAMRSQSDSGSDDAALQALLWEETKAVCSHVVPPVSDFRFYNFLFKADMRSAAGVAEETARLKEKTASALAAGKALRCDRIALALEHVVMSNCSCSLRSAGLRHAYALWSEYS